MNKHFPALCLSLLLAAFPLSAQSTEKEEEGAPPPSPLATASEEKEAGASDVEEITPAPEDKGMASGDSLANALQGAAGVKLQLMCTNCNAADVNMSGLGKDFVRLSTDGYEVREGLPGVYALSMVPADLVLKFEVLRGPGSVLTGPAGIAGGLNIRRKDPSLAPRMRGEGMVGQYHNGVANASAAGQWKKWSGDVLLTYGQSDEINPNGDGRNEQGEFGRETAEGHTSFQVTPNQKLDLGFFYYQEDQFGGPGTYYDVGAGNQWLLEDIGIRRREWTGSYEWRTPRAGTFTLWGQDSERRHRTRESEFEIPGVPFDDDARINRYRIDQDIQAWGLDWERLIADRVFLKAGFEDSEEVLDIFNPYGRFINQLYVSDQISDVAEFAQAQFSAGKRFDLTFGIRHDDHDNFGSAWLPRATVSYKAKDNLSLSLAVGEGYRAPQPIFEEVCCGTLLQTNEDVLAESSWGALLNVDYFPHPHVKVIGGLFYYDFDDFIEKFYTGANGFNGVLRWINLESVRVQGADLNLEFKAKEDRFQWGIGYTYIDPEYTGPDTLILEHPVYKEDREYPHGSEIFHVYQGLGSAFFRYEEKKIGLSLSLNGSYYGPMTIQQLDPYGIDVLPEQFESDAHQVWNFRLSKDIRERSSVFAGVDNIFDYWQADLGDPTRPTKWGPQRGIFAYAGMTITF